MPKGSEHFFHNETKDEDGLVIGFYVGAKDVADTGYEFRGNVTDADIRMPRANGLREGTLVHIDAVAAAGQGNVEIRVPIGRHNGSDKTAIRSRFRPERHARNTAARTARWSTT